MTSTPVLSPEDRRTALDRLVHHELHRTDSDTSAKNAISDGLAPHISNVVVWSSPARTIRGASFIDTATGERRSLCWPSHRFYPASRS